MEMERRSYDATLAITRVDGEQAEPAELRVKGYAAVFDRASEDMGGFIEYIAPGAFDEALAAADDVRALYNHNPDMLLARTSSGTLSLTQDQTGLGVDFSLPDTSVGRDLAVSLERGDVSQMSFAFTVAQDKWEERDDGPAIRTITQVARLYDVSPVTYPAYPDTSVALRSRDAARETVKPKDEGIEYHLPDEYTTDKARRKLALLDD